jgi:pimeloyl-ACP methyl ester carboxylesterase
MKLESITHPAPLDTVLIHGAGETNVLWKWTMEGLSGPGTAFAVNLPGHPTGELTCKTIQDYSRAVLNFIEENGLRPAVVGHSMGGAVALQLALDNPEIVSGLVLIGTGAKLGVLPDIISGLRDSPLSVIEKVITPRSFYRLDIETARLARSALAISNPAVFLNDYTACSSFDVRHRLRDVRARTLIICGERDELTPPRWSHYLHQNILSSRLYIVKDAGHMLPFEKPELCSRLVQSFLEEVSL